MLSIATSYAMNNMDSIVWSCESQLLGHVDDHTSFIEEGKQNDVLVMEFSMPFIKSLLYYL